MQVKATVRRLCHSLGFDLRRLGRGTLRLRATLAESYLLIRDLGFCPRTVVDVGVERGTPELYRAFPEAYFLLIEPLAEFEADLQAILHRYRGSYVLAAAGAAAGQATLHVQGGHLSGSSLLRHRPHATLASRELIVPVVRVDDILVERGLSGPYLIKADVQGTELAVLDGAARALPDAEVVVLEVSMFEFAEGTPQLYEVLAYMKARGWVAFDIVLQWNRPLDFALGQIDVTFVKEAGRFRLDHSYGHAPGA